MRLIEVRTVPYGPATYIWEVVKTYKGSKRPGDVVRIDQQPCIGSYNQSDVGTESLEFMDDPDRDGISHPDFCMPGGAVENNDLRLLFLDQIEKDRNTTWLAGRIERGFRDQSDDSKVVTTALGNIKVSIAGKRGTFTAKTNDAGFFESAGIPQGSYRIVPPRIAGLRVSFEGPSTFTLKPGKDVTTYVQYTHDTSVAGMLLDTDGRPIEGAKVILIPAAQPAAVDTPPSLGTDQTFRFASSRTDERGRFAINGRAPGSYKLAAVKLSNNTDITIPDLAYFGGSTSPQDARVISITTGRPLRGLSFVVSLLTERALKIKGGVYTKDGRPVSGAVVEFYRREDLLGVPLASTKTAPDGRFTLNLPTVASGVIRAVHRVSSATATACPELQPFVGIAKQSEVTIPVETAVMAASPYDTYKMRLPVNFCEGMVE